MKGQKIHSVGFTSNNVVFQVQNNVFVWNVSVAVASGDLVKR